MLVYSCPYGMYTCALTWGRKSENWRIVLPDLVNTEGAYRAGPIFPLNLVCRILVLSFSFYQKMGITPGSRACLEK